MGGFIPCSVHWFVVGKRESFWDGSCGDTNHCTMCCTGTSEHLLPLTSLVSAPGTWGVEWGPVFVVQIKTSTGSAAQMVCTVVRAPVCRSGSVQDGCMEITCGEFGIMSIRKTPFCCLFSPWSVLRYLSTEQGTASYWRGTGGGCHL